MGLVMGRSPMSTISISFAVLRSGLQGFPKHSSKNIAKALRGAFATNQDPYAHLQHTMHVLRSQPPHFCCICILIDEYRTKAKKAPGYQPFIAFMNPPIWLLRISFIQF